MIFFKNRCISLFFTIFSLELLSTFSFKFCISNMNFEKNATNIKSDPIIQGLLCEGSEL